jgi:release factor glutamine methyltransferase
LVDVGTGSGVLAVTFAKERPALRISATEISADALALARENAGNHGVADRIIWRETDLLSGTEGELDFLVANLPYVPTAEIPQLSREVRYDPMLALDGGRDGLYLIRRLISDAPAYLKTGAWIYLEIGISQSSVVAKLLEQQKFRDIFVENDYLGVERFLSARYG